METKGEKTKKIKLQLKFFSKVKKVSVKHRIFFVQQLGIMIRTGISLAVALKTVAGTSNKNFKKIILDVQHNVEKGNTFAKGLEKYEKIFGSLFVNMIRAGEESGKLEDVLQQLYIQIKKDHAIVSKVRGAMIYPSVVMTAMIGVGILVIVYIIPNITSIFTEINAPLPLTTRIVIGVSNFIIGYGAYITIGVALGIVGLTRVITLPKGRLIFHQFLLKVPIMGSIIKKINLARFCRTMSSLLKTDIAIIKTFEITASVLGNQLYKNALLEAKEKLKKGVRIQDALMPHQKLFPPVVLQMVNVGEETGTLDEVLNETALFYEEEVDQTMTNLPSIIEPVLILILGAGVAIMAMSILMPLYSLSQQI